MAIDGKVFRTAMGRFATGVTVVTLRTGDGDHGMTANAFSSVSLDPPLILVCVDKRNATHGHMEAAKGFAVNVLAEEQKEISDRFAGRFPAGQDKFADLRCTRAAVSGAPLLPGALVHLDCTLYGAHGAGDHTIFIGEVKDLALREEEGVPRPLLFYASRYRRMGEEL